MEEKILKYKFTRQLSTNTLPLLKFYNLLNSYLYFGILYLLFLLFIVKCFYNIDNSIFNLKLAANLNTVVRYS